MKITVIIQDASIEDRITLRKLGTHFVSKGELKVTKIDNLNQVWDFPLAGAHSLVLCLTEGKAIKEDIENFKDIKKEKIPEVAPTLVTESDEPTENIQQSRPLHWKTRKIRGAENQPDLFTPVKTTREDVEDFINHWHSKMWLPRIRCTPRQAKKVHEALRRPFFRDNYKECLIQYSKSTFLQGGDGKGFKFTLDWFLEQDNFDKIIEGKYDNRKPTQNEKRYDTESI